MFCFNDVETGKAREEMERSLEGWPGRPWGWLMTVVTSHVEFKCL